MIGAVVRGEDVASIGAVGIRKIGSPEPIRVDDLVHLGSCTKAMTATMIGTLVDEGKLRWDSTIARGLPRARPGDPIPTIGRSRSTSSWRTGPGCRTTSPGGTAAGACSVVEQRRALLAEALRDAADARPGSTYDYSNVGYVLAGMMAEQVDRDALGRPDEAAGLRAAGDGLGGVRPAGDARAGSTTPGATGPRATWSRRSTTTTPRRWGRPARSIARCPTGPGSPRSTSGGASAGSACSSPRPSRPCTPRAAGEEYAGGWIVVDRSWAGGRALNHNGSNTFWYCTIWLAPARDLGLPGRDQRRRQAGRGGLRPGGQRAGPLRARDGNGPGRRR